MKRWFLILLIRYLPPEDMADRLKKIKGADARCPYCISLYCGQTAYYRTSFHRFVSLAVSNPYGDRVLNKKEEEEEEDSIVAQINSVEDM
ncbi:hypothetical protein X777_03243 [Ooceraea biroi]|uniref:Uncharacterized protein n=1 Tax=Ooceraea biroi TaxID=2015173 RepID=A0A026WKJ7_OOCBI|nr:hypothetical protein X777_03243 [Ooceraea biroi]